MPRKQLIALAILFTAFITNSIFYQSYSQNCPYKIIKTLEYPINKYLNSEFYVKLDSNCSNSNLKLICASIRKEKKVDSHISATFHFVINSSVRYILLDNVKTEDGYHFFKGDQVKFNLTQILDSIRIKNEEDLPKNIVGYWATTSNPFIGLKIIYQQDSLFFVQNYYANAERGYKEKVKKKKIGNREYYMYESDGVGVYYFINEYGDIELYVDRYGFKMAFESTFYKVD